MIASVKKLNYFYLWFVIAIAAIILGTYKLYDLTQKNLYQVAVQQHQQKLEREIDTLINDRRDSSLVIALTLAENPEIEDFLCSNCPPSDKPNLNFNKLVDQLNLMTQSGDIWIHIIDRDGVSRYRSWTQKVGDSVKEIRYDVRQMLLKHTVQEGMSVGRFSLTLKSMVPILGACRT